MGLRNPETRKDGVSVDYYIAFLNGQLSLIESIRGALKDAKFSLEKNAILEEEQQKNAKTTKQKPK